MRVWDYCNYCYAAANTSMTMTMMSATSIPVITTFSNNNCLMAMTAMPKVDPWGRAKTARAPAGVLVTQFKGLQ